ncbi:hypothetical protein HD806DRAFT_276205 [Xylariaceae sp. AK1471]|nr:hypothetical protein HD806DRAFT_276205 [Xylariaceae sp. AK1471]
MKFHGISVFSTLALTACLSGVVAEKEVAASAGKGDAAANVAPEVQGEIVGNNTAIANATDAVDQNDNQDKQNNGKENANQNGNNENANQKNNGNLENSFNDINIDPNDIQGSLGQNILDLMLALGICNFNLNSIQGLNLGNEIQLLLQLQQLQQLQALGIVNSFAVDQLIQQEILSQNFNLNIIKRSINASIKQASRGKKRTVIMKRQCANADRQQGGANDRAGQADQNKVNQDQAKQDQAKQDQAEKEQDNEDQAKGEEAAQGE